MYILLFKPNTKRLGGKYKKIEPFLAIYLILFGGWLLLDNINEVRSDRGIENIVYEYLATFENEDLEALASITHKDAPTMTSEEEEQIRSTFEKFDRKYEVEKIEIIKKSGDDARVELIYTVKTVGSADSGNRVTMDLLLKKSDRWMVFGVENMKYQIIDTGGEIDEADLKALVLRFLATLENEDIEAFYLLIHEDAPPPTQESERDMKEIFENYDLKYNLDKIAYKKLSTKDATVDVVYTVNRVGGLEDLPDHRVAATMFLKKSGDQWLIYGTGPANYTSLTSLEWYNKR